MTTTALTIAGSDSGGGAGLQADLKTFHRFNVFGASAVTLVTAQNTEGVSNIHMLDPDLVVAQIDAVLSDIGAGAIKTGALGSKPIISAVVARLETVKDTPIVVDPVMVSKHGHVLLDEDAADALVEKLLPIASVVTPNLLEASALTRREITSQFAMMEASRMILDMGPDAVLIKGGQRLGDQALDVLFDGQQLLQFPAKIIETPHTHGTGCTFSAAITALLAKGSDLGEAVEEAKEFVGRAIANAPGLGKGHGPISHWA